MSTVCDDCKNWRCKKCASDVYKAYRQRVSTRTSKVLYVWASLYMYSLSEPGSSFLIMMMANFNWTHKSSLSSAADVTICMCYHQGLTRAAINVCHGVLFQHIITISSSMT